MTGSPGPMPANPATEPSGYAASPTSPGTGTSWPRALPGHLWFSERRPDDTFSGWQALGVPPLTPPSRLPQRCMGLHLHVGSHPHRRADRRGRHRQQRHRPVRLPPHAARPRHQLDAMEPSAGEQRLLRRHRGRHRLPRRPGHRHPARGLHRRRWPVPQAPPSRRHLDRLDDARQPPGRAERRHHPGAGQRRGQPAGTGTVRRGGGQHHLAQRADRSRRLVRAGPRLATRAGPSPASPSPKTEPAPSTSASPTRTTP